MRAAAAFAAILLLSGCTWMRGQLEPVPSVEPTPKPETVAKPHKIPKPAEAQPAAQPVATPTVAATPDYGARCREMADNRARDAKELGASAADQQKVRDDAYRSCTAKPVN